MARNRKRAKERRARRPQPVPSTRRDEREDSANPLAHSSPDVELAEAQLALGRPELVDDNGEPAGPELEAELEAEAELEELETEAEPEESFEDSEDGAGGELELAPEHAPERRPHAGSRLVNFIRGSWRELQRVQWPDRRQVMQATSVVIGFVIIAGVFLGVADFLSGKLMDYVLK